MLRRRVRNVAWAGDVGLTWQFCDERTNHCPQPAWHRLKAESVTSVAELSGRR